jgi:hypothetical protein
MTGCLGPVGNGVVSTEIDASVLSSDGVSC